jgi:hypothetical protein
MGHAGTVADDDDQRDAPPAVTASVAAGVAPTPFLLVYAVLFLAHGFVHPVQPPDITTTRGGEKVAGLITLLLLLAMVLTLFWFMNGRRRWPFVVGQLATLVTSVDFVFDPGTGSPAVPIVLALTSATALVFAFLPASGDYVGSRIRLPRRRADGSPGTHELHSNLP